MTDPSNNEPHQRLLQLWHELEGASQWGEVTANLSELTARDLSFFHRVLKDCLVIRGAAGGPFSVAFVGTDLEALLGRMLHDAPFGLGLSTLDVVRVEQAFVDMVQAHRPMVMSAKLTSSRRTDRLEGGILCVPLAGELRPRHQACAGDEVTILGLFALAGGCPLPPEPTHPRIEITATTIL